MKTSVYSSEKNDRLSQTQLSPSKSVIWAVDPSEEDLVPDSTSLQLLKIYLGEGLKTVYPVYVTSGLTTDPSLYSQLDSLEKVIKHLIPESKVQTEIIHCHSQRRQKKVQQLLNFSYRMGAQLILVSSHGRSGWNRVALGSFAETLLEESSIPLWFVPRKIAKNCNLLRVLFATDFTDHSKQGYSEFLKLVQGVAKELILYHMVNFPIEGISACGAAGVPSFYPNQAVEAQFSWAQEQARLWVDQAKESGLSTHLHAVIREAFPSAGKTILEIASRQKIALIGIASQRAPWSRTLFGSVACEVFRAQSHTVWVCGAKFYS
jgi:nucleotide-binding universal stress UspA family protein